MQKWYEFGLILSVFFLFAFAHSWRDAFMIVIGMGLSSFLILSSREYI